MKLKNFIGTLAVIAVIASSNTGFAATWRHSHKDIVTIPSRAGKNDYYYEDFTKVEPGSLPAGIIGASNENGIHTTEIANIGGLDKNCYVLNDLTHQKGMGSTTASTVSLKNLKGLVGVDIRFKYEKTGSSDWSSFVIEYNSPEGIASRMVCASANGTLNYNFAGIGNTKLDEQVVPGHWYTLRYIIDFNLQKVDCELVHEATKKRTQVLQAPFFAEGHFSNLSSIKFRSSEYGGKWFTDYIRVYRAQAHMEEAEFEGKKGSADPVLVPGPKAISVKGRTNIMIDGRYKFTTKAPKVNGDVVLVTANNVASFFGLAYEETAKGVFMKDNNAQFTVANDGSGIKKGSSVMKLSAPCVVEGKEIFIPIGDIAKELGYNYNYDVTSDEVTLTTSLEKGVK